MSQSSWWEIKHSIRFYISTYRRAGSMLFVSAAINLILCVGIFYSYFNRPMPDYYSTNGVTPPDKLTSMDKPNDKSVALLANDPENHHDIKVIPQ